MTDHAIAEASGAITHALAEIEEAKRGLAVVVAERNALRVTVENLRTSHEFPRVEDVAEFARLRGLIKQAEKTGYNTAVCPWCSHADRPTSSREGWKHTASCPAFTAEGAVR